MKDWNVVVTVAEDQFSRARDSLKRLGRVESTHFYNTLLMRVHDIHSLLETVAGPSGPDPAVARIAPVSDAFDFRSLEDFDTKARKILAAYVPQLTGKSFHVRVHRRGGKDKIGASSLLEQRLGRTLLEELASAGAPGHIDFQYPDAIIDVETVDNRAGIALWTRKDLEQYPCLKID